MERKEITVSRDFFLTLTIKTYPKDTNKKNKELERRIVLCTEGDTVFDPGIVREIVKQLLDNLWQNINDKELYDVLNPQR